MTNETLRLMASAMTDCEWCQVAGGARTRASAHVHFAPRLLELPGVKAAVVGRRRLMQVCAVRSCGTFGAVSRLKKDGAPTTAIRMSGAIRTEIMPPPGTHQCERRTVQPQYRSG